LRKLCAQGDRSFSDFAAKSWEAAQPLTGNAREPDGHIFSDQLPTQGSYAAH